MKYYEKTEPGEAFNELHSILGTEYLSLGPELEDYYKHYFKDSAALVALHQKVAQTFLKLHEEADSLANEIEKLAHSINSKKAQYDVEVAGFNQSVEYFNTHAQEFTTQQDFQAARQRLINKSKELGDFRQSILADIAKYKTLLAKLDAINAEAASLNASLDSTLSDVPKI